MLHPVTAKDQDLTRPISKLEVDVLCLFGRFLKVLGYPKSVGEIYGILYLSGFSMPMGDISDRLGLSMGSVSQGLKALKEIDVIEVSHCEEDRKDHFKAKTDFGRFLRCFLKDQIQPGVKNIGHSIDRIRQEASSDLSLGQVTVGRIESVQEIYELLASLVHVVKVELETDK